MDSSTPIFRSLLYRVIAELDFLDLTDLNAWISVPGGDSMGEGGQSIKINVIWSSASVLPPIDRARY
jgi:hypothetical protein